MADCFINRHGQSNPYTYGENIFDLETFKTALMACETPAANGNIEWLDNGFVLSATLNDCYTNHTASSSIPHFEVDANTMYELSWTATGDDGRNFIFFDFPANLTRFTSFNNQQNSRIFCTLDNTTQIILRFGVQNAGTSCTFTDIKLRQIIQ